MSSFFSDEQTYHVVEGEHARLSIWPTDRPLPTGWQKTATTGPRAECLAWLERKKASDSFTRRGGSSGGMKFGLMFFGDDERPSVEGRYHMVIECAKFADRHGFAGIWLPERHFTKFGCLYPSPAVLHAAIARETRQIRLRAGSVVMPLHHAVRVAEEWSVVDNLSHGRVDLSFASGWHPQDFALRPEAYADRYQQMLDGIEQVRRLWRGEKIPLTDGNGQPVEVRIYPTPVQAELPFWLTAASSPRTFAAAGDLGANVVTHLFDQQIDALADKIKAYRDARQKAGYDPATGEVTVALHTFVAGSLDEVRAQARNAYCEYLRSNIGLLGSLALSRGVDVDVTKLPAADLDELLKWLFEKFLGGRSLLGTPETCRETVEQLRKVGVTEIACLLDFGPSQQAVLESLPRLAELQAAVANA